MTKNYPEISEVPGYNPLKGLEIYLWTKNNWSSEVAPGGGNTKKWLEAIYKKIVDDTWTCKISIISKQNIT